MIVLYILLVVLLSLGVVYGFYDLVHGWLQPKVERAIPKVQRMIPKVKASAVKLKELIPKRKPKRHRIAPYDIVDETHADHRRRKLLRKSDAPKPSIDYYNQDRSPLASQILNRPWGSVSVSERRRVAERVGQELTMKGVPSAVAAQVQQELQKTENDLFWNQIAQECQRVTGSTDFKSYDPNLGLKKSENKS